MTVVFFYSNSKKLEKKAGALVPKRLFCPVNRSIVCGKALSLAFVPVSAMILNPN
jgi:hypothetical protein